MQTQTLTNNISNASYGLRSYQNGTRSPYVTPEVQRPRPTVPVQPAVPAPSPAVRQMAKSIASNMQAKQPIQSMMQNTIQKTTTAPKTTNIDSMKFLESMTKIYEKNGRSDLAHGLKTNMQKAKVSMGA